MAIEHYQWFIVKRFFELSSFVAPRHLSPRYLDRKSVV